MAGARRKGGGGGNSGRGRGKAGAGGSRGHSRREGGKAGSVLPVGSQFMKTVTTSGIADLRDAHPEDSEEYRVYDACLMRRTEGTGLRRIAAKVGIPYETLRRRLIACNSRREAVRYDDRRYIERGRYRSFVVSPESLYGGVEEMNRGKNGRPFKYSEEGIKKAAVFRVAADMRWRELQGWMEDQAGGRFDVPSYSEIRQRAAKINIRQGATDGDPFLEVCGTRHKVRFFIADGSSCRATSRSEFRTMVYGNASHKSCKVAVAIDGDAKTVLNVAVLGEGKGESGEMISGLIQGAMDKARSDPNIDIEDAVVCMYDGAADKEEVYAGAARAGCGLLAPVRIDSSSELGSGNDPAPADPAPADPAPADPAKAPGPGPAEPDGAALRRVAVYLQNGGLDGATPENKAKMDRMSPEEKSKNRIDWRLKNRFSMRVAVEGWYAGLKMTMGDRISARTRGGMEQELLLKVGIYNHMVHDALANGWTGKREVVCEGWTGKKGPSKGKRAPSKGKRRSTTSGSRKPGGQDGSKEGQTAAGAKSGGTKTGIG